VIAEVQLAGIAFADRFAAVLHVIRRICHGENGCK
jgi:hypothetical protein